MQRQQLIAFRLPLVGSRGGAREGSASERKGLRRARARHRGGSRPSGSDSNGSRNRDQHQQVGARARAWLLEHSIDRPVWPARPDRRPGARLRAEVNLDRPNGRPVIGPIGRPRGPSRATFASISATSFAPKVPTQFNCTWGSSRVWPTCCGSRLRAATVAFVITVLSRARARPAQN